MRSLRAANRRVFDAWLAGLHGCWTLTRNRWPTYRNALGALTGEWL